MEILNTIKNETAVLLYFQDNNCPPCKSLRPKIITMVEEQFPEIELIFIDSYNETALAAHFGVFAHPTLLIFFEGKEYIRASKYVSVVELSSKIDRLYQMIIN